MSAEGVVTIIGAALSLLEQIAPAIASLFTGGRPVAELIAEAKKAAAAIPTRPAASALDAHAERRRVAIAAHAPAIRTLLASPTLKPAERQALLALSRDDEVTAEQPLPKARPR